jgi:DNA-binding transcriptional LysR family regulator
LVQRAKLLVDEVAELQQTRLRLQLGQVGSFRVGMGSGPGAMLMRPLLMLMAKEHPQAHLDISRGSTALLVQALRERALDALVVDIRSLQPASDLKLEALQEMRGAFMCRPAHPLAAHARVDFGRLMDYPIASTPLSDEVARILLERFGPQAHPDQLINLRCEEISSLIEVALHSDTVLLAIRASAPQLVELPVTPALNAWARFGLVTVAGRSQAPLLGKLKELMAVIMKDGANALAH